MVKLICEGCRRLAEVAEENERLQDKVANRDRLLEIAKEDITTLGEQIDQLIEQAALRTPSSVEKDMQLVMGINNNLRAETNRLETEIAEANERERCARIVEQHRLPAKLAEAWPLEAAIIAAAIRDVDDAH